MKRVLLTLGFLCVIHLSWAGNIYRWKDADGHVHFSSTPGPNQSAKASQGSDSGSASDYHTRSSLRQIFSGNWRGSSRTSNVELRFLRNGKLLTWYSLPRGGGVAPEHFTASWEYAKGDLHIVYTRHVEDSSRNGSRAILRIIDKSTDSLTLQFPDGQVYKLHKRQRYKRLSMNERKIKGKWILSGMSPQEWELSSRGFMIRQIQKDNNYHSPIASGSWKVEGDTLVLTHLNDNYVRDKIHRTGEVQRFSILLQDDAQLILKGTGGEKQMVFQRKR